MIKICEYCLKEYPDIEKKVETAQKEGTVFSLIYCEYHFIHLQLTAGKTKEEVKQTLKRIRHSPAFKTAPRLKDRPDLIKKYKSGIFDEPWAS